MFRLQIFCIELIRLVPLRRVYISTLQVYWASRLTINFLVPLSYKYMYTHARACAHMHAHARIHTHSNAYM